MHAAGIHILQIIHEQTDMCVLHIYLYYMTKELEMKLTAHKLILIILMNEKEENKDRQ